MSQSKWFAEAALRLEALYVQHHQKIERVAAVGRVWGTRVEDLKSPVGVLGRALRTVPEVVGLARAFSSEPNTVYAEAILKQELPFIVLGTEEQAAAHDYRPATRQGNPNSMNIMGLLRGIASVLNLKNEQIPLFNEPGGKPELCSFKLHLGDGVVVGTLVPGSQDLVPLYAPLRSSHDPETTRAKLTSLWEKQGIIGLNIKAGNGNSDEATHNAFANCSITRIDPPEPLVVGSDFANDYKRIAERVMRFEKAGYKRNLMLLGPPGCGKTSIAQQIALQIGRFTINVDSGMLATVLIQVISHFFHSVILICDDFDRYHGDTQALLSSLEKTGSSLIVTCNTVYGFDKAAVRVGRIDEIIDVPKPDAEMRRRLFHHFCQHTSGVQISDDELDLIVNATDGFTPAEMREVVKCFKVLGFEDSKLEITRIQRQSEIAESLWFKLDWTGMSQDQINSLRNQRFGEIPPKPRKRRNYEVVDEVVRDNEDEDELES
jgi:hypothetical protein